MTWNKAEHREPVIESARFRLSLSAFPGNPWRSHAANPQIRSHNRILTSENHHIKRFSISISESEAYWVLFRFLYGGQFADPGLIIHIDDLGWRAVA